MIVNMLQKLSAATLKLSSTGLIPPPHSDPDKQDCGNSRNRREWTIISKHLWRTDLEGGLEYQALTALVIVHVAKSGQENLLCVWQWQCMGGKSSRSCSPSASSSARLAIPEVVDLTASLCQDLLPGGWPSASTVPNFRQFAWCVLTLTVPHGAHDVVATLNQRQWCWFNIATESCAQLGTAVDCS